MAKLVMLSGGVDSTAALVKVLSETGDDLFVHHIYLKNDMRRERPELVAVDKIVQYCQEKYRPFNFTMSYLDLSFMKNNVQPDVYSVTYMSALIIRQFPEIDCVIVSAIADDSLNPEMEERRIVSRHIFKSFFLGRQMPHVDMPLANMTKEQVIDILPSELLELTWSCRKPKIDRDNNYIRCGKCHTCISIESVSAPMDLHAT